MNVLDVLLENGRPWHYLGALLFCVAVTLPLELFLGARVYRHPKRLALTIAVVAVPFLVLDWFAVGAGLWWFSPDHTLGVKLGRLPVEELLFFVVVPLCALLTHGVVTARPWRRMPALLPARVRPAGRRRPTSER